MSAGGSDQPAAAAPISDEQRNGSISALAIVLGFSLSFTGSWIHDEGAWTAQSLAVALLAVLPGIVLQLHALFGLMALPVVDVTHHQALMSRFRVGIAVVLGAYVLNALLDAATDLSH